MDDRFGAVRDEARFCRESAAIASCAPGIDNLFLTNGSSGHGVMHAPAIGQLIAEMIAEGKTSIDVRALRPARFAEGEAIEGSELL